MKDRVARIGDVYEVDTGTGLGYVQFAHDGGKMGELIRVLPGLFSTRPNISELAREHEMYFVFFTLEHSLGEKLVQFISNEPTPEGARSFPIMRKRGGIDGSGKTLNWFIGDGRKLSTLEEMRQAKNVDELSREQENLSIQQLWPYPVLVKKLAQRWTPAGAEGIRLAAAKGPQPSRVGESVNLQSDMIEHYLYFEIKRNADLVADRLRAKGWSAVVRMGGDGKNWLVLGQTHVSPAGDIEDVRNELEELALSLGGEYDGWGIPLSPKNLS